MLILSGPDNLSLRRFPVVSISIICLCVATMLLGEFFGPFPTRVPKQAREYYAHHAYLKVDEQMLDLVAQDGVLTFYTNRTIAPPEDPEVLANQQASQVA